MPRDPLDVEGAVMPAVLGPFAALVIMRYAPETPRMLQTKARVYAGAGQPQIARELALARESLLRAARAQNDAFGIETSAVGTSELLSDGDQQESSRPPNSGMTPGEAAKQLGITPRQITNLCKPEGEGRLLAAKVGGRWVIDVESVALDKERRRSQ